MQLRVKTFAHSDKILFAQQKKEREKINERSTIIIK